MISEREQTQLDTMVAESIDAYALDDAQAEQFRDALTDSWGDLTGCDGWYWLGERHADLWLDDLAERISSGSLPQSFLDYEEVRADSATLSP